VQAKRITGSVNYAQLTLTIPTVAHAHAHRRGAIVSQEAALVERTVFVVMI
jgi:hypothetical protein